MWRGRAPLLEDGVEDLDVDQHGLGGDGPVGLQRLRAPEGWNHDAAEAFMSPRIVRDRRAKEIVIGSSLQGVLVEIEHLLRRESEEARRELRAKTPPRVGILLPGRQLLYDDVGMGEEERGGEIVPDRDAAEEDQMKFVRQGMRAVGGEDEARVAPGPQHLAIEAFDRDRVRVKGAGLFASGDSGEADRLCPRRSLRGDVLEFAGMSGIGEQRAANR